MRVPIREHIKPLGPWLIPRQTNYDSRARTQPPTCSTEVMRKRPMTPGSDRMTCRRAGCQRRHHRLAESRHEHPLLVLSLPLYDFYCTYLCARPYLCVLTLLVAYCFKCVFCPSSVRFQSSKYCNPWIRKFLATVITNTMRNEREPSGIWSYE